MPGMPRQAAFALVASASLKDLVTGFEKAGITSPPKTWSEFERVASTWNDCFGPSIHASESPGAWTLSYGLESFKGAHHTDWNLTMAAAVLVMAP